MFQREIIFKQDTPAFHHVPSLVITPDGSVLAFCEEHWRSPCDDTGECHIVMKKSGDGGETWGPLVHLRKREGAKFHMGSVAVDAAGNRVLLMCDGGWLESRDNGENWQDWTPHVYHPQGAHPGSTHGSGPGIVLQYGVHRGRGRMVWPGRTIVSDTGYDDLSIPDRQAKCYSMVFFSDDRGATIHSSHFFLQGTGEGCLSERCNGDLYFNVRAYWGDGCRYTAVSISWKPRRMRTCGKCRKGAAPAWFATRRSCVGGVTSSCSSILIRSVAAGSVEWCGRVSTEGFIGR